VAVSDAQYKAWLRQDNVERCLLVEVEAYSGGAVVTRYLSDKGYTSAPTDSPANQAYDEILVEAPRFKAAMREVFRGDSLVSFGELSIDNSSGERDAWLLDAWDGRPVRIYHGSPWWPKADFRLILSGTIGDIGATERHRLVLRVRDKQHLLTVPIQTALIAGTTANKDRRKPITLGEVFNVEPVLVDDATHTYQVHDGQIHGIDVYQNQVLLTLGAHYTVNLAAGTFSLVSAATGRITCDVRGSKSGGVYVHKTAELVHRILTERAGFDPSEIDVASYDQLNVDAPGGAGIYISDDNETVLSAIDALIASAGGFHTIGRDGKFYMGLFKAPAGAAVAELGDDDVVQGKVELRRRILPMKSVRCGYRRNWTPVRDGLPTSLSEAERARLGESCQVVKATNSLVGHLLAEDGPVEETCFVASSDAQAECNRRAALWGQLRFVFRIETYLAPSQAKLGDVLLADLSAFNLGGGVPVRVIGVEDRLSKNRVALEVFL
jgi:hypothetical protein